MSNPLIQTHRDGEITVLTLNRPEKRNALNVPLMEALCRSVEETAREPRQRVIILRGQGPVFCAGLDLTVAMDPVRAEEAITWVGRLLTAIYESPLVTIAAVEGAAIAGGAGLMSACDFAVGAEDARFGYPEVHRGLVAGVVMTFLRRQLRERDARELLLLGELIGAQRALEIGLINRVVPKGKAMEEARRLGELALKGPPHTMARTKQLLDQLWPRAVTDDMKCAMDGHAAARNSEEAQEGIAAFLEKRAPHWQRPSSGADL